MIIVNDIKLSFVSEEGLNIQLSVEYRPATYAHRPTFNMPFDEACDRIEQLMGVSRDVATYILVHLPTTFRDENQRWRRTPETFYYMFVVNGIMTAKDKEEALSFLEKARFDRPIDFLNELELFSKRNYFAKKIERDK